MICRILWTAIADFAWPALGSHPHSSQRLPCPPSDAFLARFLAALNSRQAAQASALYDPAAIQVRADQILSGTAAIQAGYAAFFDSLPAGTIFTISQTQAEDDSRQFSWKAGPLTGETTLVLRTGKSSWITLSFVKNNQCCAFSCEHFACMTLL